MIVTNGDEVRLLDAYSGKRLGETSVSEEQFSAVVTAAARAASGDVKQAIQTLMGTNPTIWRQAVEHVNDATIAELTATSKNPALPFVAGFLLNRKATAAVLAHLENGERLILVEGPPLIGKSNVLRELVQKTRKGDKFATLLLEATGSGAMQALADTLAGKLDWPVTREEARSWLMRLSRAAEEPVLVLAVDGLGPRQTGFLQEIEELTSPAFGNGVRVVVAVDDTAAQRLIAGNGRSPSMIGRRAKRVTVGHLDDKEFDEAQANLWEHRIGMMLGAASSLELRFPWVLRAMVWTIIENSRHGQPEFMAVLSPLVSLRLIAEARRQFIEPELQRAYHELAKALLKDSQDRRRPISLILESLGIYIVRRKKAEKRLSGAEIYELIDRGYLKPTAHSSGEPILMIRLPELLASELAKLIAIELEQRSQSDPGQVATWLAGAASNLPLGDIVCAQAIVDACARDGRSLYPVISTLLDRRPTVGSFEPGARFAMHTAGIGQVDFNVQSDGSIIARSAGGQTVIAADPVEGLGETYGDFHSWMILSHLAGLPFALETDAFVRRVDPIVLLEVGAAEMVLRQPGPEMQFNGVLTHDLPGVGSIVCHTAGIVEAITYSMFLYLSEEGAKAANWIEEACRRKSLPLVARLQIALQFLTELGNEDDQAFAREMLKGPVAKAFKQFPPIHPKDDEAA
ncbi:hypothetical protein [Mesorhizobium sp. M0013]|uniref:hypothetical protein n=1 Tax=Mesorhizobium sp. M0013 TaxID=2956841 RepID=UPI003336FB31